jgi:hypothetical protein
MSTTIVRFTPSVTMDPSAYLPSTWRMAKGALLTNHRITHYTRLGFYGKDAQEKATKRLGLRPCSCDSKQSAFMRFSYLPQSGWYCELCRLKYRANHEKVEQATKELNKRIREANKALKQEADARREAKRALYEQVFD